MKTYTRNYQTFELNELSDKAREKAIQYIIDTSGYDDWWDDIFENAKNIGLKIEEFDFYGKNIKGCLIEDACGCAHLIIDNHDKLCKTYQTAKNFIKEYNDGLVTEEEERIIDGKLEQCKDLFKHALLEDFLAILHKEYEYITSEECAVDTIETNDYEFLADGTIFYSN